MALNSHVFRWTFWFLFVFYPSHFYFLMEVVVHDGVIREKPSTPEEARKFIKGLCYCGWNKLMWLCSSAVPLRILLNVSLWCIMHMRSFAHFSNHSLLITRCLCSKKKHYPLVHWMPEVDAMHPFLDHYGRCKFRAEHLFSTPSVTYYSIWRCFFF